MDSSYNLAAIRRLLLGAFRPETLRRFCQDRPAFRPIIDTFGPGHGLDDMVDRVIDYCLHHHLFSELLVAIEQDFPRQHSRFGPYGEQAISEPQAPDPVELARWNEKLKTYNKRMAERYGTTQIFGQPRPVPLEQVFTDVYILEKPVAFRRFDIQQLQQDLDLIHDAKRIPGRILVTRPDAHRLFILGRPGAGKTTFLKHLVLEATTGELDKVPVFVALKEWADTRKDLRTFIVQQFAICGFPDAGPCVDHLLRETETCLILFDGFDEVSQENKAHGQAIAALKDFADQYPRAQCLVTCRTATTDYTFERFGYVEVADFTPEQIQTLVRKWFHAEPGKGETFLAEINKEQNRRLVELARTPLLLAMLCLAFNETLRFPARRAEVYQDALDALLRKWDSSRSIRRDEVYRALSPGRKQQLFARIAAQSFEQGVYFIPQANLEAHIRDYLSGLPRADRAGETKIDSLQVLHSIEAQHGILVERAYKIFAFAHLSFQEYYTARYVTENQARGAARRLLAHCTDPRWHEVILLTASLLHDADEFFVEFRHAIDKLLEKNERLTVMARWAAERATRTPNSRSEAAIRTGYWSLILHRGVAMLVADARDWARDIASDLARGHDLDRDLVKARALGHNLDIARNRDYDIAHNLDLDHSIFCDIDRDIDLAYELSRNLSRNLDLAHDLTRPHARELIEVERAGDKACYLMQLLDDVAWKVCNLMAEISAAVGASDLYTDLLALKCLKNKPHSLRTRLRVVMSEGVGYGYGVEWSHKEQEDVGDYLEAHRLLLECLDLAYVSNRQAIEDSLLLPPGMWHPEDFTR